MKISNPLWMSFSKIIYTLIVITGDKTQVDLPKREDSGLMQVERILHGIEGIAFHYFGEADVVRHRLVRDIIRAYNEDAAGGG